VRFGAPQARRAPREAVVPMINVVFLLLIFFLMTAVIAAPPPFDLTLPEAETDEVAEGGDVLYVGPDGALAYGSARGEAVFAALSARSPDAPLEIRADAGLPADTIAGLLPKLAEVGGGIAYLVAVGR
jgi:biopolymer transport protein ExbD